MSIPRRQDCLPIRLKQFHVCQVSYHFDATPHFQTRYSALHHPHSNGFILFDRIVTFNGRINQIGCKNNKVAKGCYLMRPVIQINKGNYFRISRSDIPLYDYNSEYVILYVKIPI